ncbi:MAG: response regulator [Eggerthellaceae bacterium]|nr:response regulator [Eggerthellaceae bacterium]
MNREKNSIVPIAIIGSIIVIVILVLGTIWMGRSASRDTEEAVRSVSLLYLDELAGRREQVVEDDLNDNIEKMNIAISTLTEEDLSDIEHLQAFQMKMRQLLDLERFAFVDETGLIYTATGTETGIEQYAFDYATITGPEVSVKDVESEDKKVIIAVPMDNLPFNGHELVACFMQIDMDVMLKGASISTQNSEATYCNIYTSNGTPLSNTVLAGSAAEGNLFDALSNAVFMEGDSLEGVVEDFTQGRKGVISFNYGGTSEVLSYVPIQGTDWFLTYLIRESVISKQIGSITQGTIYRSIAQSILTALVLMALFGIIIWQTRRSARLALENEISEAANRAKREELEEKLSLQEKLLEEERRRVQQDRMITALASDYRSVQYVSLDDDTGICYRSDPLAEEFSEEGRHFPFHETFSAYAERYVAESYREGFLEFIDPENIRAGLEDQLIIVYRYLVERNGKESYEMLRMAGVRHAEDRDDHIVHAVGVGFSDIDQEMRESMAKSQALSDALTASEEASKAKTTFLSSMSHEIRTPMNAIIGLDSIALSDPDISPQTRDYLEKIGSSAQHLLTIINDILDMSRIESGRMTLKNEEFSLPKLIEQVNTIFSGQCTEKGLQYECKINGHVDDYYIGDNMKLRQVIINILGNAVKFTPEGGSVDFTVERVAQYNGKSTLKFVMQDTGIGMSEEYLPHLFDAFSQEDGTTTSKYGSSGLGMAITKNIVEMMNGKIKVESQKGVGTTFTVTVTLLDSERNADDGEGELEPSEMCVLIVDDDPVACEHARLVLENVGISSDKALSGAEAIEMVRLRHARRNPYNLILVDWKMPEMDGVETTRQIRSIIGNESAIIILTAYKWDDVLEEALGAGVDSFLAKPLFASSVLDEFRSALRAKGIIGPSCAKADLVGRRILLAEDVPVNAEIMVMVLEMREMEVEHAENGLIAVQMYESHPAGYYDAVLMDMRMPEMDGLEATMAIRASGRPDASSIPIIALTANAFDEDVQRSLQAGLNAHLSKPVEPEDLYKTLESLIQA